MGFKMHVNLWISLMKINSQYYAKLNLPELRLEH